MATKKKSAKDTQAAFNFDTTAMEAEIAAVKEKHLSGAKARLEELEGQRTTLEAEIEKLRDLLGLGSAVKRSGGGKRTRTTKAAMDEACVKLLDAMSHEYMSKEAIGEKAGVDRDMVNKAMAKLDRQGKVESNGERGAAGAWRLKKGK